MSGIKFFAVHGKGAFLAFGISCGAAVPTEQNDPMAEIAALLRREDLAQLLLHLFRILTGGEAQPSADTDAVGVTDHTAGYTVQITQK